ncbi:MAG: hypothetical protein IPL73_06725 [Candidatus Obscuribacter sp.]|nr:hypothetical protein [Candidatus Obscuribacter sp.]
MKAKAGPSCRAGSPPRSPSSKRVRRHQPGNHAGLTAAVRTRTSPPAQAIAACEGFFQCECRGVGNDFRPTTSCAPSPASCWARWT